MQKNKNVLMVVYSAMMICLGSVLSNIKLYSFPTGGSLTLCSSLMIALPGYFFGPYAGFLAAVSYGLVQLAIKPEIYYPMQVVLDYVLAFGAFGISGFFRNKKKGLTQGFCAGSVLRFVFSTLSGYLFFGEYAQWGLHPLAYSAIYNAIYIFAEAILTVLVLQIPSVDRAIKFVKNKID